MKIRILPIAAAAALMLSGSAFAQRDGGGHHGPGDGPPPPPPPGDTTGPGGHEGPRGNHGLVPFWNNEQIVEAMALSDDQIANLQASLDETLACLEGTRDAVIEAQIYLRDTLHGDEGGSYPEIVQEALIALQIAKAAPEACIMDHKIAVQMILYDAQEEVLASLGRHRPPRDEGGEDAAKTLSGGDGPGTGDGDLDPERRARMIVQNLMPMIHRALADCVIDPEEQALIDEVLARLSEEVRPLVEELLAARIAEIQENCDPADVEAAVAAAVDTLTALINDLAEDGLTCEDVHSVHRALRELPRRVRYLAAPQVLDYLHQLIEEQGGISDCREPLPEGALAAYRELLQMIRDAARDEEGLTEAEEAEILAALALYPQEIQDAISPRLLDIIARVFARQADGATEEDKAYEIPDDLNKPQSRSRHGVDTSPTTDGIQIHDRDRTRLSQ